MDSYFEVGLYPVFLEFKINNLLLKFIFAICSYAVFVHSISNTIKNCKNVARLFIKCDVKNLSMGLIFWKLIWFFCCFYENSSKQTSLKHSWLFFHGIRNDLKNFWNESEARHFEINRPLTKERKFRELINLIDSWFLSKGTAPCNVNNHSKCCI